MTSPRGDGPSQRARRAALWDLDGTILDTEHHWAAAKADVASTLGIPWSDEDARWSVGRPTNAYAARMAGRSGGRSVPEIGAMISEQVASRLQREPALRPGAARLLAELRANGWASALVTMAGRAVAEAAESVIGHRFDAIIAGEDVVESKPHPEPYLRAMEALGLGADDCVAIEDSERGAASAEAAGLVVACVPSSPDAIRPREGRRFFGSLDELSVDTVTELRRPR